jgi:LPXTG-site transpeptidase (sortase) family protein
MDDNKHKDQFSASFHLPGDDDKPEPENNPAADLIRKKIEAAYVHEPDASDETEEVEELGAKTQRSKHQEFIYNLTNSGRPLHEIQAKDKVKEHPAARKAVSSKPLHSLLFGLGIGSVVIIVFLFSFFNERIISPFIQPSRNVTNIPIITGGSVSQDPEVIIPKINVEIPVVYTVNTINETAVEKGLESGVVHYADTAVPGQNGNVVIVGHSSNNILNPGKYKFAFTLLHDLQPGDTFYLQKEGKRYTYQVYQRRIVSPDDVSVLGLADKTATATLITCDPPGTSNNRLVITAEQISPDPSTNVASTTQNKLAVSSTIVPGNSPTLWSRITKWFEQ